jgi:general secretion pathway protein A
MTISLSEHFGWKSHPFADTWFMDRPFYSQRDQRIVDQGMQLLQHGKSFAVTGPSGTGKSTLVQHLLKSLDTNYYHGLHIHYGGLQRTALLKTMGEQFGVETNTRTVPILVKLQKHILTMATGKHPVHPVILVDDAQLLERESFMDLCSLIVCPPKKVTTASLIVVGDDTLSKQMALTVMTPIRTRLTVNFRMEPLDDKETEQFIAFRLRCAKAPEDLFEPDALALVAAHCHGNRREIMNLGTLLLGEAFYRNEKSVSAELITGCDLIA